MIKDFLLLFRSAKTRPRIDKPKYRVEHITDGKGRFWSKICKACGRPDMELVDGGRAVACNCGWKES